MKHSYIDEYSGLDTFIHRLDPRIKLISLAVFILFIISTKAVSGASFVLYALFLSILALAAKIPAVFILKRSLVIIPFVLMATIFIPFFREGRTLYGYSFGILRVKITYEGLMILWNCLIKAYLSVVCVIIFMASTKFSDLLKALEALKCPALLLMIISFMYRYIFVIEDVFMKMEQAKEARSVARRWWLNNKVLASILGVLFICTYEQAEYVYLAMCARGFSGKIKTLSDFRIKKTDLMFLGLTAAILAAIRLTIK